MRWLLAVLAVAAMLAPDRARAGKLIVVTTTTDLAAIARAVGGAHVEVEAIARGDEDPHYLQAKPSYMRRLRRADLLIYNGLELEIGWLPLLVQGSRNPRVLPGAVGSLDASVGVPLLEVPTGEVDRSMGDIHPEGNPHYTMDPRNGLIIAATVAARLERLSPGNAEDFTASLYAFRVELRHHIAEWEEQLAHLRGREVITAHKQWEYLAEWLGLGIAGCIEEKPGIPPAPRHVAHLLGLMQRAGIAVIIHANSADAKPAERVAARSQAIAVELPAAVAAEEGISTYADLFHTIIHRLATAFPDTPSGSDDG